VAVVATSALSLVLALTGEVTGLAETLVLLLLIVFAAVNAAVLVLRRRDDGEPDHFRVPAVVPVLGIASCLVLFTRIDGAVWLRGLVLVGLGVLLAVVNSVRRGRVGPSAGGAGADGTGAGEPAAGGTGAGDPAVEGPRA
jgi:amino acid transporter